MILINSSHKIMLLPKSISLPKGYTYIKELCIYCSKFYYLYYPEKPEAVDVYEVCPHCYCIIYHNQIKEYKMLVINTIPKFIKDNPVLVPFYRHFVKFDPEVVKENFTDNYLLMRFKKPKKTAYVVLQPRIVLPFCTITTYDQSGCWVSDFYDTLSLPKIC